MFELNDLLGGSDDESNEGSQKSELIEKQEKSLPQPTAKENDDDEESFNVTRKITKQSQSNEKKADLSNLLGESDDEEEDDAMEVDEDPASSSEAIKTNELDQIFGERVSDVYEPQTKNKSKLKSQLLIPKAFKIPSTNQAIFLRTPNFVKIQSTVYDPFHYNPTEEKKELDGASSVIRYRINPNGDDIESNARFLQWSDGSRQLIVGDAVFDMKIIPTENCYVFQHQTTIQTNEDGGDVEKFHLECNGPLESRILLQPHSLDSDIHTRMTLKFSEKSKREKKITIRDYETIIEAPEKTLQKLIRQEEEEMRKLRKKREQNSEGRAFMINTSRKGPSMSADYLNEEEEVEEEEEEEQQEIRRPKKKESAKKPKPQSRRRKSDEADESDGDEDEDDERQFSPEGSDDGESLGAEDSYSEEEEEEEAVEDEDEEEEEAVEEEDDEDDEESAGEDSGEEEKKPKKNKEKGDKKARKQKDKEKRRKEKRESSKRKRPEREENEDDDNSAAAPAPPPAVTSTLTELQDDEDEGFNIPQRKKAKRAFVDSDEEV